jgi:hypothetical protein
VMDPFAAWYPFVVGAVGGGVEGCECLSLRHHFRCAITSSHEQTSGAVVAEPTTAIGAQLLRCVAPGDVFATGA